MQCHNTRTRSRTSAHRDMDEATTPLPGLNERLNLAIQLEQSNQVLQAELHYIDILKGWPQSVDAATQLARLALKRGDAARAVRPDRCR